MEFEGAAILITALLGGGGIAALLKARSDLIKAKSETRNANKITDVQALSEALKNLQDRYQEAISDCIQHNREISQRVKILEEKHIRQNEEKVLLNAKIKALEDKLDLANNKIEFLEKELKRRDLKIMKLERQNIDLRKENGKRTGL